ncbi:hypothetical protein L5515_018005 [Caenorhabditis briggsae]|uniref:Uncharacterized protein n=1 Tax=Caenorhabditis briggsae TaxID=6238 RepID=A0AAE9JRQ3_CAEBR|nr:hypothetical protein L5515_018005 [Caenorhabditis briggsae]
MPSQRKYQIVIKVDPSLIGKRKRQIEAARKNLENDIWWWTYLIQISCSFYHLFRFYSDGEEDPLQSNKFLCALAMFLLNVATIVASRKKSWFANIQDNILFVHLAWFPICIAMFPSLPSTDTITPAQIYCRSGSYAILIFVALGQMRHFQLYVQYTEKEYEILPKSKK